MLRSRKLKLDGPNVRDVACRPQPNGTGVGFMAANGEDSSMIDDIVCLGCQWPNQRHLVV